MRKLTGISEELRSKNCRTVYDVLTQASQNPADQLGKPRDKITNQMIYNCKYNILNYQKIRDGIAPTNKKTAIMNHNVLWEHENFPPEELIPVLKSCLDLNAAYQKQYEITKDRLMNMPKGKQFEFSPNQIFGKFDLFCRRVLKLIELFGTI